MSGKNMKVLRTSSTTALNAILKIASAFSMLCLSACGTIEHKISGTINISIDLEKLAVYFRPVCEDELPGASDTEIDNCVTEKVGAFLNDIIVEEQSQNG
jgi:hypothetical protein